MGIVAECYRSRMKHRSRLLQRSKELCKLETAIMIHKARKAKRDMAARGISLSDHGRRWRGKTTRPGL